jgi:hypothetical protein
MTAAPSLNAGSEAVVPALTVASQLDGFLDLGFFLQSDSSDRSALSLSCDAALWSIV